MKQTNLLNKKRFVLFLPNINAIYSWKNFEKYWKLKKLIRVFAYILRFINNLKNKNNKTLTDVLSVDELNQSQNKLIMFAQIDSFSNEYYALKKNKPLPKTSNILCLKPYLENGLIRVGGRIENSPYSHDKKHPILINTYLPNL